MRNDEIINKQMTERIKQRENIISKIDKEIEGLQDIFKTLLTLKNAVKNGDSACSGCPIHCIAGITKVLPPKKQPKTIVRKKSTKQGIKKQKKLDILQGVTRDQMFV